MSLYFTCISLKQKKCLACRPLRPLEARERVYSTFSSLTLQKEHTPQHSHCAALRLLRWRSPNHLLAALSRNINA